MPNVSLNSPWYFYLIAVIIALAVSLWLYVGGRQNKETPTAVVRFLFALRFLSTAIILLLLLNIFLKRVVNETQNPLILIALDNSSSMVSGADSTFIKKEFPLELEALKKNIGKKFIVKTLLFGEKAVLNNRAVDFSDKETDIENLVKEVENNYSGQNTGALVIASDGIYNRGSSPLYLAEKLGFPVYAIATGDTTENPDAFVQKINHNQISYLGNDFPVEVLAGAKKLKGSNLTVRLYQDGRLKAEQKVKVGSDNFSSAFTLTLNASQAGILKYDVVIENTGGEKNIANNRQSFVIEIIDNRDKILLLAASPHPDFQALRETFLNFDNYELECGFYETFNKPLKAYSLIILHGFGNAQHGLLNESRQNAIPFWIVNPVDYNNLPGIKINPLYNRFNDAEPNLQQSFTLFNVSDALKKFSKNLPAVKTFFGSYVLSNTASSLFNQKLGSVETNNPLLFFAENNDLKYGIFLGDGLWRWKMRDFVEHGNHNLFKELVGKTVQYLAVKGDKSFFRVNPPRIINENESAEFDAEVYNKSYERITGPDVSLTITNQDKKNFNYIFSKTTNAHHLNAGKLAPGNYTYEARVNNNNQLMVKKGSFTIKEVLSEKINTIANHRLLHQLAQRTGGKLVYPAHMQKLSRELLNSETIKPITYSQISVSPLIELVWLCTLALAFLATEWWLRKRYMRI